MELMRQRKDGQPQGGEQTADVSSATMSMSDTGTPPMASPMSTPEPTMGSREGALVNLGMALDLLEQSLPALGSESEEGASVVNAIRVLNRVLGSKKGKTNELQQSEILQMLQTLPQAGGASPEVRALMQSQGQGALAAPQQP